MALEINNNLALNTVYVPDDTDRSAEIQDKNELLFTILSGGENRSNIVNDGGKKLFSVPELHPPLGGRLPAEEAIHQISVLLIQMGIEERKSSREARLLERKGVIDAILAQADKIRQAATYELAAGIVQGTLSMAGGFYQAYHISHTMDQTQAYFAMGVQQLATATGGVIGTTLTYEQKITESDREKLRAEEKTFDFAQDNSSKWMDTAHEYIQAGFDILKDVNQMAFQVFSSIIRNM